jgi:hypothetical protein
VSGEIAISQTAAPSTHAAQAPQAAPAAPVAPVAPVAPANVDPIAAQAASKRPLVNPGLHLDLALNLVVLQFVDDKGDVTRSIPSEKQLKAYQSQQTDVKTHATQATTPRVEG